MDRRLLGFTKGFSVNSLGEVFNPDGSKRNQYVNGDGYITVNVKLCDDRWVTFGVHRLVALAFITDKTPEQTEVNHRDSDIKNIAATNLEWVTAYQNNIHSELMRNDDAYLRVYSSKDDVPVKMYFNAHEAGMDNNCTPLEVWDSIKDNREVNGVQFHYRARSKSLPQQLSHDRRNNLRVGGTASPKPIKLLDIDNGEVLEFPSFMTAGKHFNVSASHVHQAVSRGTSPKVFLKKYQVQYADRDFPIMTPEELRRAKTYGIKKVMACNLNNKTFTFFPSASEFIRFSNLSRKTVTVNLKKNKLKKTGDWIALYMSPENAETMKSYISGPAEV